MSKVIVERPRFRSRANNDEKGQLKRLQKGRTNDELLPRRASTSRHRRKDPKDLNEHLGPLRRFLNQRVGQHWKKVYAEIRENISPDSAVQMHIMQHVLGPFGYVETNVKAWPNGTFTHMRGQALHSGWFVNPKTGCLQKNPESYIHGPRRLGRAQTQQSKYISIDGKYFREIDGIWYELQFAVVPVPTSNNRGNSIDMAEIERGYSYPLRGMSPFPPIHDAVLRGPATFEELFEAHGRGADGQFFYATSKRQLSSKEIKRYHLRPTELPIPASNTRR